MTTVLAANSSSISNSKPTPLMKTPLAITILALGSALLPVQAADLHLMLHKHVPQKGVLPRGLKAEVARRAAPQAPQQQRIQQESAQRQGRHDIDLKERQRREQQPWLEVAFLRCGIKPEVARAGG